ncbi:MAG: alanine racemase [Asticcacaulis sp.]
MTPTAELESLSEGCGGYVRVDLNALDGNYRLLCQQAHPHPVAAVVKADAYGLGVEPVSRVLYAAGCRHFFVAHASEAFALRPNLPEDAALYVLNGLLPGSEAFCADQGIIPVLNGLDQVVRWAHIANARFMRLPAVLQIDTGMSRLGISPEDIDTVKATPEVSEAIDICLIMSHLACADTPDNPANARQLAQMRKMADLFPDVPLSFVNSSGLFLPAAFRLGLARPGVALYGGSPNLSLPNPMQAVVSLHVGVIQTRSVKAGTEIGYGGTFVAEKPMRLATIAAGYADGLPRSLSNRGAAWFDGVRLPIVGRVSMDSIIIDISALPEGALSLGSFVELIGPQQSLDAIAADAGTISYEILTSLGRRFHRQYLPVSQTLSENMP